MQTQRTYQSTSITIHLYRGRYRMAILNDSLMVLMSGFRVEGFCHFLSLLADIHISTLCVESVVEGGRGEREGEGEERGRESHVIACSSAPEHTHTFSVYIVQFVKRLV